MERTLNCLVIDDDPEVNAYVCEMIGQTPFLTLDGTFDHAPAALPTLEAGNIDLLVLDINLPGINGVSFAATLRGLTAYPPPKVILISGSRDYAVEGYKVDAVDYLVKPFSYEEFYKAVSKVRAMIQLRKAAPLGDFLFLKVEHDLVRVNIADISFIESAKDYVKVCCRDKVITALSTLKAIEERLTGHRFMRVHRSFIVNLDKIEQIQHLTIRFGKTIIPVTEQYREAFKAEFREWL
ncbi:DNA-binding response regulator [Mucilaginibacter conchicola]|uniref:DNA-binding response regulator n=1 Tax=Mucilaginibacter conchicola TaxID=2303333 RepID=A0A372NQY7_9SPHI|nr:LytTR family DNA-binding domain-containing protein [Mucilaginibacter conchicola]RFZ91341.1 DNA-binding response regulator [Mucilaginibacter conchicola]